MLYLQDEEEMIFEIDSLDSKQIHAYQLFLVEPTIYTYELDITITQAKQSHMIKYLFDMIDYTTVNFFDNENCTVTLINDSFYIRFNYNQTSFLNYT